MTFKWVKELGSSTLMPFIQEHSIYWRLVPPLEPQQQPGSEHPSLQHPGLQLGAVCSQLQRARGSGAPCAHCRRWSSAPLRAGGFAVSGRLMVSIDPEAIKLHGQGRSEEPGWLQS